MGRYYFGDIEGKFAFAIQSSDAADRFGVSGEQNTLSYYFGSDNLDTIEEELKNILINFLMSEELITVFQILMNKKSLK